jgi:hypothetical protein
MAAKMKRGVSHTARSPELYTSFYVAVKTSKRKLTKVAYINSSFRKKKSEDLLVYSYDLRNPKIIINMKLNIY